MPSLLYPSTGLQVLSALIHLSGVSVLSHCLSRRLAAEEIFSWHLLKQISWPRLCIILIFFDSWLFLFSSGILIFGVGLEMEPAVCATAIYLCVAFYATSKVLIYLFLIEKVHIVWSSSSKAPRFRSPIFIICFLTVSLYSVVIALMVIGRNHYFRDGDGACVIGLKHYASVSLLSYDLYVNIFLTALFLYPLLRSKFRNARVRLVATRTLVASGFALTTSTVNMCVLTIMRGRQLGWICLGAGCGVDVVLNALVLFWLTSKGARQGSQEESAGRRKTPERPYPLDFLPSRQMAVFLSHPDSPYGPSLRGQARAYFDVPNTATTPNFGVSDQPSSSKVNPLKVTDIIKFADKAEGINSDASAGEISPSVAERAGLPKRSVWSRVFGRKSSLDDGLQITVTTQIEQETDVQKPAEPLAHSKSQISDRTSV